MKGVFSDYIYTVLESKMAFFFSTFFSSEMKCFITLILDLC